MRELVIFSWIFVSAFISGCSNNYIIISKLLTTTNSGVPPEIVETPTYKQDISKFKTVAVRAPSSCSNRTSDQQKGSAKSESVVLRTNCAVEMALIERALTKASYKVISWSEIDKEIERNLSAHQIAAKMGAQVLFQINSLEKSARSFGKVGKDEKLEYSYYNSNDKAEILGPKAFDDESREYLKRTFFDNNNQYDNVKLPIVTLDATAINTKDGEAIWFYQWTLSDASNLDYIQKLFISCKTTTSCEFDSINNEEDDKNDKKNDKKSNSVSKENEQHNIKDQPEDAYDASYALLLNSVINNFVYSFTKPINSQQ